jgi:hypothetical protein
MLVLMHFNPKLPHQVRHAEAFKAAGCEITPSPQGEADVHIVSGPYFALPRWRDHPNVIWLDRAFYGDPEYVQMFWLNPDGSRTYASGTEPRLKPELKPWKTAEESVLVLADFQQNTNHTEHVLQGLFRAVKVRRHPAEAGIKSGETPDVPLADDLDEADVCIGRSSTALFEAVVLGVPVVCTDPRNIVAEVAAPGLGSALYRGDREEWLHRVSWMQFNHEEFGMALNLLLAQRGLAC